MSVTRQCFQYGWAGTKASGPISATAIRHVTNTTITPFPSLVHVPFSLPLYHNGNEIRVKDNVLKITY